MEFTAFSPDLPIFLPVYRFYKAFTAFFCLLSKRKIIFQFIFGHKKQDAEYDILCIYFSAI